jgi:hypothetical protein
LDCKKDNITQYYIILLNIPKITYILNAVPEEIQLTQRSNIEHGQDILIGWNKDLIPGPKEPIPI